MFHSLDKAKREKEREEQWGEIEEAREEQEAEGGGSPPPPSNDDASINTIRRRYAKSSMINQDTGVIILINIPTYTDSVPPVLRL